MGWIMAPDRPSKPLIFNYDKSTKQYRKSTNPPYYSWKSRYLWDKEDSCICFQNTTKSVMKISKVAIQTCSCNSGGKQYWSSTGLVTPCSGYGGTYYSKIRVTSTTDLNTAISSSVVFKESSVGNNEVANCGYNMNSAGTSTTNCAVFGNYPYAGKEGLSYRQFIIDDCPEIPLNGFAFLHIGISRWNSGSVSSNTTVRFILDPTVMEVEFEPTSQPYIWRFNESHKWELVRPIYVRVNDEWKSIEGIESK